MKLRVKLPISESTDVIEGMALAGMREHVGVNLFGVPVGVARVLAYDDDSLDIEIETAPGVVMSFDVGRYSPGMTVTTDAYLDPNVCPVCGGTFGGPEMIRSPLDNQDHLCDDGYHRKRVVVEDVTD